MYYLILINPKQSDKYLGSLISADGTNTANIDYKVSKGLGTVSPIMTMLKYLNFGIHYFKIGTLFRDSILINTMLSNIEVIYGLTQRQIDQLQEVDKLLLRQILDAPSKTPVCAARGQWVER